MAISVIIGPTAKITIYLDSALRKVYENAYYNIKTMFEN